MPAETVFAVHRLNWLRTDTGWLRLPGTTRLATLPTLADADADRRQREDDARRSVNPFQCGGPALHYQTSFDADRLHDWIMDAGFEPPPVHDGKRDWAEWWDTHAGSLTPSQWSRIWEGLDKLRFFETVEQPKRPVLYAVVEINWQYNDSGYTAEAEGGKPMELYRSRQRADDACEEYNELRRDFWEDDIPEHEWEDFDQGDRVQQRADPFGPGPTEPLMVSGDDAVFFEVIEVELEGEA